MQANYKTEKMDKNKNNEKNIYSKEQSHKSNKPNHYTTKRDHND